MLMLNPRHKMPMACVQQVTGILHLAGNTSGRTQKLTVAHLLNAISYVYSNYEVHLETEAMRDLSTTHAFSQSSHQTGRSLRVVL
jgi:hypothetical protein